MTLPRPRSCERCFHHPYGLAHTSRRRRRARPADAQHAAVVTHELPDRHRSAPAEDEKDAPRRLRNGRRGDDPVDEVIDVAGPSRPRPPAGSTIRLPFSARTASIVHPRSAGRDLHAGRTIVQGISPRRERRGRPARWRSSCRRSGRRWGPHGSALVDLALEVEAEDDGEDRWTKRSASRRSPVHGADAGDHVPFRVPVPGSVHRGHSGRVDNESCSLSRMALPVPRLADVPRDDPRSPPARRSTPEPRSRASRSARLGPGP